MPYSWCHFLDHRVVHGRVADVVPQALLAVRKLDVTNSQL